MIARFLPLALLLSACAPQNAVLVDGEYFAFISDSTSFSLQKGVVDPYDWGDEMWTIDCRNFIDAKERKALQLTGIADDCAEGEASERCIDRRLKSICNDWIEVPQTEPLELRPAHETWLAQSPWWVLHEKLDPWRGEAVITSEGDIQVGFHHRLPGGEDFRFYFAFDPDFAPQQCNIETGEPEPRDGDWVVEWTADLKSQMKGTDAFDHFDKFEGGSMFFLNADGFQFNPDNTLDYWFVPEQWEAGAAAGKFSEEAFFSRSPRWGLNEIYEFFEVYDPGEGYGVQPGPTELYFCALEEGEDAESNTCWTGNEEELVEIVDSIRSDAGNALSPSKENSNSWSPMYHNNLWRTADGTKAGFDGWHELHYNMVVFDQTPEQMAKIEAGDSFSGAFTLVLDGLDSNSRWLVRGEFEVPKLKKDRWVTEDIRARKLEENGNSLCILQ